MPVAARRYWPILCSPSARRSILGSTRAAMALTRSLVVLFDSCACASADKIDVARSVLAGSVVSGLGVRLSGVNGSRGSVFFDCSRIVSHSAFSSRSLRDDCQWTEQLLLEGNFSYLSTSCSISRSFVVFCILRGFGFLTIVVGSTSFWTAISTLDKSNRFDSYIPVRTSSTFQASTSRLSAILLGFAALP